MEGKARKLFGRFSRKLEKTAISEDSKSIFYSCKWELIYGK